MRPEDRTTHALYRRCSQACVQSCLSLGMITMLMAPGSGLHPYHRSCPWPYRGDCAFEYNRGVETFNLGTGKGSSVLEVVAAFRRASNRSIPYTIKARRNGDIAQCVANPTKANELLGWRADRTLEAMCVDVWRWRSKYSKGFDR